MARTCAACGRANDDDARFCQQCGSAVAPSPSGRPGGALQGSSARPPGEAAVARACRGRPTPHWLALLVAGVVVALVVVMALAFVPRRAVEGGGDGAGGGPATTLASSKAPALDQYLAGIVGPEADGLAAILRDGTARPVVRFTGQQLGHLAYSPDGALLACIAGKAGRGGVWLFDTATGDARQTTAGMPGFAAADSIAWLSPGQLLIAAYTATPKGAGRNADFLVYDTASGDFTPLMDSAGLALHGVSVSSSRDGGSVAFVTYGDLEPDGSAADADERLEVLDRETGRVTELARGSADVGAGVRAFDEPLISPNGLAVIFRRTGEAGTGYTVLGADGRLLMPEKRARAPAGYAWDPGGAKVMFAGRPATGAGDQAISFWLFDTLAGGEPTVIAHCGNAWVRDLAWSPDGSTIAWSACERDEARTRSIFMMPATGGDAHRLAQGANSPAWAPDAAEPLHTSPSP